MKKIMMVVISLITCVNLFSQSTSNLLVDDKLMIDSLYLNKDELLLESKVLNFEGKTKDELITMVKNWGSTRFVNLKEVLVSETSDQLVIVYIDKSFTIKTLGMTSANSWYIRLVIQVKDNKIRCSAYDDGNVFVPATQYSISEAARSYTLKISFKTDGDKTFAIKKATHGLVNLKNSVEITINSLRDYKDNNTSGPSNDW
jgi:hypothetical protein